MTLFIIGIIGIGFLLAIIYVLSSGNNPQKNIKNSSIDIEPLVEDAIIRIYEKENGGRKATCNEKRQIIEKARDIANHPSRGNPPIDDEIKAIQRLEKIEKQAQNIRMVIVCYIECLESPYPSVLKRNISYIKENHSELLKTTRGRKPSKKVVSFSYHDLFEDELIHLDNEDAHKRFFKEYTADPGSLTLKPIEDAVKEKYKAELPKDLFIL